MAGANSKARVGGARSTNGNVVGFLTATCPTESSPTEIDVSDYTNVYIAPEVFDRRVIFQDDNTDISTNIVGSSSFLIKANEECSLDVAGRTNKMYISTNSGGSSTANGLRIKYYDET